MSIKLVSKVAAFVVAGSMLVAGTAANATNYTSDTVTGSGSTFAYNGINNCISRYSDNKITYTGIGSGDGRTNFRTNSATYSFAVSDGLYDSGTEPSNPLSGSGYTMAALFGGPVVFAYSKRIPGGLKLDATVISKIYKGEITKWNDPAIKSLNKQFSARNWSKLKNKTIKVYYRNTSSGTTENFSNYMLQTLGGSAGWAKKKFIYGTGNALAIDAPANAVGKGTSSQVADAVEADNYGFGYFDLSDAKTAAVKIAKLKNARGQFITPTASAGAKFLNAQTLSSTGTPRTDGTMTIDFTKSVKNAYQLTIVTYGVAPKASSDNKAKAVEDFFAFVVNSCMPAQADRLGYIALTGSLKTNALAQIAGISN